MHRLSKHARQRCAQRALRPRAIDTILAWAHEYGRGEQRTRAFFLGRRQVARAAAAGVDLGRFVNTAVLVAGATVVTAYRTTSTAHLRRVGWRRRGT